MKRYQVSIRGGNLLLNLDGEHRRCSLQAVRYLRAIDADQAAKTALIQVRQARSLQERLCDIGGAPPQLQVVSVTELGRLAFWRKRDLTEFSFDDEEAAGTTAAGPLTEP